MTFYSYKGGTGRSMGLVNVAWIMASNGYRVLIVDWDLEAPGLHRYFHPLLPDSDLRSSPGVIDLVWEFVTAAVDPDGTEEEGWHERLADVSPYAMSVKFAFPGDGTIDMVPAGRQDAMYSSLVSSFDWTTFYERLGGGGFLEALRRSMRERYDYILIDSRTGLSDTAGICTVQMPDILVDCFVLSTQAVEGAAAIATSVAAQRPADTLRIFPVPMRVEDGEQEKLEAGRDFARARFADVIGHLSDPTGYWGDVEVPYRPYYAYEEILATVADRPRQENTLLAAFERLTSYLTDGRVTRLVPIESETERRQLLDSFQRGRRKPGVPIARPLEVTPVAPTSGPPDPAASQVVLIGAAAYRHLAAVPAVERNLADLRSALGDPQIWGVPPDRVTVLLNPADPAEVSSAVRRAADQADHDGALLLYFAGHGLIDPDDGTLYLATADTDPRAPYERGVPYEWLRRAMANTRASQRIVILDCSYAGRASFPGQERGTARVPARAGLGEQWADLAESAGTAVFVATGGSQHALAPPGQTNTAFTGALLNTLRDGIAGAGPVLTVEELWRETRRNLTAAGLPEPELRVQRRSDVPFVRNVAHQLRIRTGDVLSAAAHVATGDLARAVVLILRYEPGVGAMGIRIDRPAGPLPSGLAAEWRALVAPPALVFDGGPIARDGFIAVARLRTGSPPPPGFMPISGRLGTISLAFGAARSPAIAGVRLFAGYLGWGPGEVEADLDDGTLVQVEGTPRPVLAAAPAMLWDELNGRPPSSSGDRR